MWPYLMCVFLGFALTLLVEFIIYEILSLKEKEDDTDN